MMDDYSGFYFNKQGIYENIVFYISPIPNQELYMIRKYSVMLNTNNVLKSIETGFNGYDYEIYKVIFKTQTTENPENDDEMLAIVDFIDFSNRQQFEGIIIIDKNMPMYERLDNYIFETTKELPFLTEGRDPKNKVITETPPQPKSPAPKEEVKPVVKEEPVFEEVHETPKPKSFAEQVQTPQQAAMQGAESLASQIVRNNNVDNNNNDINQ